MGLWGGRGAAVGQEGGHAMGQIWGSLGSCYDLWDCGVAVGQAIGQELGQAMGQLGVML